MEVEQSINSHLYAWADGRTNTFTYFATNEPSVANAEAKDCTIILDTTYQNGWGTADCSEKYECYFCEKPSEFNMTVK